MLKLFPTKLKLPLFAEVKTRLKRKKFKNRGEVNFYNGSNLYFSMKEAQITKLRRGERIAMIDCTIVIQVSRCSVHRDRESWRGVVTD